MQKRYLKKIELSVSDAVTKAGVYKLHLEKVEMGVEIIINNYNRFRISCDDIDKKKFPNVYGSDVRYSHYSDIFSGYLLDLFEDPSSIFSKYLQHVKSYSLLEKSIKDEEKKS